MRRAHVVLALLAVCCVPAILQAQTPADLVQAIKARDQATDKVDVAAWERLAASEFTEVLESGRLLTREQVRAKLSNQAPATTVFVCRLERVATLGNGVAATRRCLSDGNWWIEVWEKSSGVWRALAVRGTPAAK